MEGGVTLIDDINYLIKSLILTIGPLGIELKYEKSSIDVCSHSPKFMVLLLLSSELILKLQIASYHAGVVVAEQLKGFDSNQKVWDLNPTEL